MDGLKHLSTPRYFIARPDGTLTPLIAMDELPLDVRLEGVSRVLKSEDTKGMISLGVSQCGGGYHNADTAESDVSEPKAESVRTTTGTTNTPQNETDSSPASNTSSSKEEEEETPPPPKHREYCSYWVRFGKCAYTDQGCLYKHIMPTDAEILKKMGLSKLPRWFIEASGYEIASKGRGNKGIMSRSPRGGLNRAVSMTGLSSSKAGNKPPCFPDRGRGLEGMSRGPHANAGIRPASMVGSNPQAVKTIVPSFRGRGAVKYDAPKEMMHRGGNAPVHTPSSAAGTLIDCSLPNNNTPVPPSLKLGGGQRQDDVPFLAPAKKRVIPAVAPKTDLLTWSPPTLREPRRLFEEPGAMAKEK